MKTGTDPEFMSAQPRDDPSPDTRVYGCVFEPDLFQEFVDTLGQAKARFWLAAFRDGLMEEFAQPSGQGHDYAKSRASVHNFCAQAGLTGFRGLHEACLYFLESGEDQEDAYRRVRIQTELAVPEIERLCDMLE